jgi:hypothetical protein
MPSLEIGPGNALARLFAELAPNVPGPRLRRFPQSRRDFELGSQLRLIR